MHRKLSSYSEPSSTHINLYNHSTSTACGLENKHIIIRIQKWPHYILALDSSGAIFEALPLPLEPSYICVWCAHVCNVCVCLRVFLLNFWKPLHKFYPFSFKIYGWFNITRGQSQVEILHYFSCKFQSDHCDVSPVVQNYRWRWGTYILPRWIYAARVNHPFTPFGYTIMHTVQPCMLVYGFCISKKGGKGGGGLGLSAGCNTHGSY